jgi:hypothetical protein
MAKRNKAARYRLTRDIVVQQGIEGLHEPQVTKHRSDCISILLALSRDHTAELLLNREDAIVLGLVERVGRESRR